ncbi:MAG: FAD-dependent oxidoreductase, partial [Bdellovibrionales bacterium]|nr:FAD-dependent oxidoreductase [Bdellovibrionales bacterium]
RLDEQCEIILLEKGKYVSFANCGLPYYLGGAITDRSKLLVQTPEGLRSLLNIDVRVLCEVEKIDKHQKSVWVRNHTSGENFEIAYDELVLATGSVPLIPPIPGIDSPRHHSLRTIDDMDAIYQELSRVSSVAVVGGGYIGVEAAEQLSERGLKVSLVEAAPHILAPFDSDMVVMLEDKLSSHGIELFLGDAVQSFEEKDSVSVLHLHSGIQIEAGLVILAIGGRPAAQLAREAGLELGDFGGVRVSEQLKTSDTHIWAAGDSIEVLDPVTNQFAYVPLAGPANRQGRIIADNLCGIKSSYKGSIGTAVIKVFDLCAACTGANESKLKKSGIAYRKVYLHPNSHAGYYPGASKIAFKLLFEEGSGRVLGAQAIGAEGADKRIDVIATAIKANFTIDDLVDLELCYAPPFGSAKDPVNIAGMVAQNVMRGLVPTISWDELSSKALPERVLLDVRTTMERDQGTIAGSIHIPINELRDRLPELPQGKEIVCFCASGQRSALACRMLLQHGFTCCNLSGAYFTWKPNQSF